MNIAICRCGCCCVESSSSVPAVSHALGTSTNSCQWKPPSIPPVALHPDSPTKSLTNKRTGVWTVCMHLTEEMHTSNQKWLVGSSNIRQHHEGLCLTVMPTWPGVWRWKSLRLVFFLKFSSHFSNNFSTSVMFWIHKQKCGGVDADQCIWEETVLRDCALICIVGMQMAQVMTAGVKHFHFYMVGWRVLHTRQ